MAEWLAEEADSVNTGELPAHQIYLRFFGLRIWHIYDKRTTRTLCGKDAGYYSKQEKALPEYDGRPCLVCFGD